MWGFYCMVTRLMCRIQFSIASFRSVNQLHTVYYNAIYQYTENAAKELHLIHIFLSGYDGCFEPSYASESAAAIITMVLQHTDNGCKLFLSVLKHILPHLCSF